MRACGIHLADLDGVGKSTLTGNRGSATGAYSQFPASRRIALRNWPFRIPTSYLSASCLYYDIQDHSPTQISLSSHRFRLRGRSQPPPTTPCEIKVKDVLRPCSRDSELRLLQNVLDILPTESRRCDIPKSVYLQ